VFAGDVVGGGIVIPSLSEVVVSCVGSLGAWAMPVLNMRFKIGFWGCVGSYAMPDSHSRNWSHIFVSVY